MSKAPATYFIIKLDRHPSAKEVAIAGPYPNAKAARVELEHFQARQYYALDSVLYVCSKSNAVQVALYDKRWEVRTENMLCDVDWHEAERARMDKLISDKSRLG